MNQVARGDARGDHRVGEPELRQVADERLVQVELAFVDQHAEQGGGHRLGGRADGEKGVGRDRLLARDVAPAETLGVDHLAAGDHRDPEAGHVEILDRLLERGVDAGERQPGLLGRAGAARELEGQLAAALAEGTGDLGAVVRQGAVEGRLARNARHLETHGFAFENDLRQREVAKVLRRDRNVAGQRAVLGAQVDVDLELARRQLDRTLASGRRPWLLRPRPARRSRRPARSRRIG